MALMTSRQQSEFISAVVRHLPCDRIPADVAQYYISNPRELAALLERFVPEQAIPAVPRPKIVRRIKLTLDYSTMPVVALEATKCDSVSLLMQSYCPHWGGAGKQDVVVCIIDMRGKWFVSDAHAVIERLGLIPAPDNLALWTLSRVHPNLQRKISIVDPGIVWRTERGDACVPYLDGYSGSRQAGLCHVSTKWDSRFHVLALSK